MGRRLCVLRQGTDLRICRGCEHMVDVDTILTEDERHIVKESFEHGRDGKLIQLSDFKKQIGL